LLHHPFSLLLFLLHHPVPLLLFLLQRLGNLLILLLVLGSRFCDEFMEAGAEVVEGVGVVWAQLDAVSNTLATH
jgi:hypothetical protein